MPSRTNRILEILTERTRVEVSQLADELGVSQVTMRKDLTELERRHLIRREHGFAVLCSPDNVEGRLAYHYEEKRAIAKRAAALVRDGDTIMVESGSCCALLVAQLAAERREVTDADVDRRLRARRPHGQGGAPGRHLPEGLAGHGWSHGAAVRRGVLR